MRGKKIFLLLILTLGFSLSNYASQQDSILLKEILVISDEVERAVEWNFFFYYMRRKNGKALKKFHPIIEKNLSHPPLKELVTLLDQSEINLYEQQKEVAYNQVLDAITILTILSSEHKAYKKLLCQSYIRAARISRFVGAEEKGFEFAYKGLKLAHSIHFLPGQIEAHNQIGLLFSVVGNEKELSISHYLEAAKLKLENKPYYKFLEVSILGNLAIPFYHQKKYDEGIKYAKQALEISKKYNFTASLSFFYHTLGKGYFQIQKYDLAEQNFIKAIQLKDSLGSTANKGFPLLWLSEIQLKKNNIQQASYYNQQVSQWLKTHKFTDNFHIKYLNIQSEIERKKGNLEQSIYWLEKAIEKKDAVTAKINYNKILELENKYGLKKIEQEKMFMGNEVKLNSQLTNANKLLLGLSAILGCIVIAFFVNTYRQKQSINEAYDFILKRNRLLKDSKTLASNTQIDQILKEKITYALEQEKIYLSKELSLKTFADHLQSNTSYISKTINDGFGKNFSTLISEYRIREVLQLFETKQYKSYTIEALAQRAGFKSKSAFHKTFKKQMGVTASYYLKKLSTQ